ncbi:hypothetical protein ZIOFF_025508 [Zingiber officinale]|uniref:non-specific serine/threonine protein kinase n=1 Tax=Zingiber officinale TaxID=94328 RepID=A0A8J5GV42_ZINOF|nr:hypothetical protein ZIOFF_025508 [Zingiber officinale]
MFRKEDWSFLHFLILYLIFFNVPRTCAVNFTTNCSEDRYDQSSGFGESLTSLFSSLRSLSSTSNCANTTAGANSNTVYGLYMCQGDLSHSDCHSCITSAIVVINQNCSNSRTGILWYEFCQLRYSDHNFFGIPVTEGHFTINPKEETSSNKPYEVLSSLVQVAPLSKPLMFARNVSNMYPLFAQAQCTSDLSTENCSMCLRTILEAIKSCCIQRKGWRYFTPTCLVRYEPTPFFGNYPNANFTYIIRSRCLPHNFLSSDISSREASLRSLLSDLHSRAPTTGFYSTSSGENSNQLFGMALCRGDLATPSGECTNCLDTAGAAIVDECPNKTEGFMWYSQCFLKYSDQNFFGMLDNNGSIYCDNGQGSSEIDATTNAKARSLVPFVVTNSLMFAADKVAINNTLSSYLLLQCTRDLSIDNCQSCLETGISTVTTACKLTRGWQYLSGSCNVRFETFPFYNETAASRILELQPEGTTRSRSRKVKIIAIILPLVGAVLLGLFLWCTQQLKRRIGKRKHKLDDHKSQKSRSLIFIDLAIIKVATNNFSDENKLGEGGFGPVYKGVFPDGREIAVKRLSQESQQGTTEFKNEVELIAKLQHKNLVKMLGCCVEREEKLLIYEYLSNGSLDSILFGKFLLILSICLLVMEKADPDKRIQLDWERRFHIISGIAKGLLYLHEDSLLKVIHRDLKSSNVLLDGQMNPKISDFGMAKIYQPEDSEVATRRIVGTYGYMAPEYAIHGVFSVKSDVYSYGVLLLEIVCGLKNGRAHFAEHGKNLPRRVWELWNEDKAASIIDPVLKISCSTDEALKCIHIGLLCVHEKAEERPTMSEVVLMLRTEGMVLPKPSQPPDFARRSSGSDGLLFASVTPPSSLKSINEVTDSVAIPR